ncbi:unnamed protein product [Hymenolepis diminuta]|uniref:Uncharacterized protein n=1 Tax=Hymenolepis diminuta TaxID=6216 RepID=A0A564Y1E3_HYMDI|nr:unnamed protein product [Hymenolepis diminuta]
MVQWNASEHGYVRRISQLSTKKKRQENILNKKPPSPYWLCGKMHYSRGYPYRDYICNVCGMEEAKCGTIKRAFKEKGCL